MAVESHKDWIYVLCGPLLLYFYIIFGPSCVRLVRFRHQIYLVGFRKEIMVCVRVEPATALTARYCKTELSKERACQKNIWLTKTNTSHYFGALM